EKKVHRARVRIAFKHPAAFEGIDADAVLPLRSEVPRGKHVRVPPLSVLGVVREECRICAWLCGDERIPEVSTRGISCLRNGDAVIERQAVKSAIWVHPPCSELREDPAILHFVVQHDRITRRIGAIRNRKPCPHITNLCRSGQPVALFIVNGKHYVNQLHVMITTYFAVRIRWIYPEAKQVEVVQI